MDFANYEPRTYQGFGSGQRQPESTRHKILKYVAAGLIGHLLLSATCGRGCSPKHAYAPQRAESFVAASYMLSQPAGLERLVRN
jgi:hypothetical protein